MDLSTYNLQSFSVLSLTDGHVGSTFLRVTGNHIYGFLAQTFIGHFISSEVTIIFITEVTITMLIKQNRVNIPQNRIFPIHWLNFLAISSKCVRNIHRFDFLWSSNDKQH